MLGEMCIIRARMAAMRENAALTTELSNRALDLLPEDELHLRGDVALDLGHAYCSVGDFESASEAFARAAATGRAADDLRTALFALHYQASLEIARGRLLKAEDAAVGRASGWPRAGPRACLRSPASSTSGWASCYYQRGELDEARRLLEEGIERGRRSGEAKILVYGYVNLARVLMARGDAEGAHSLILEAGGLTPRWPLIWAWQARFWLAQGDVAFGGALGAGVRGDRRLPELPAPLRADHDGPRVTRGGQDRRGFRLPRQATGGREIRGPDGARDRASRAARARLRTAGRDGRGVGPPEARSRSPNRRDSCACSSTRGRRWPLC